MTLLLVAALWYNTKGPELTAEMIGAGTACTNPPRAFYPMTLLLVAALWYNTKGPELTAEMIGAGTCPGGRPDK